MVIVMDSSQGQLLPHDSSGFLIGERLVKGVDLVGKDTAEILKLLRASFGLQVVSNNRLRVTLDRIINKLDRQTVDATPSPVPSRGNGDSRNANPLPTVDVGAPSDNNRPIPPTREYGDPAPDNGGNGSGNAAPTPSPTIDPPIPQNGDIEPPMPEDDGRRNNGRRRNARGQFEGDVLTDEERKKKAEEAAKAKAEKEANDDLKKSIMEGISLGNADTHNIDPTVDAVRELGDLMSPLAKVGKTMFKGAAWLFRRKKKREEPSDQEQRQQSRIEKLLKRIAGSRVGQAAGSGFNLFGGLFSSLTGTVGGALRFIPALISSIFSPIASVFRVVPSLIMGAIAPIGRVLTSLAPMLMRFLPIALGVTAAFKLGEWVGGKIYDAIGPKLGEAVDWTVDAVKAIPEKISKAWDGVVGAASNGIEAIVNGTKNLKDKVVNATVNAKDKVVNGAKGLMELGKGVYKQAVSNMTDKMEDVFSGGSQTPISKVKATGKGFNETELADGSVIRRTGSRNWRNNNSGNIEYGDFAKKHGAIGSDGRFAVFPTYEAGRSAKSDLIFNGKNYKDLDLMGAINRYAPPTENDTAKYQRSVLASVGGANKRMSDYTPKERERILDAMEKMEGFKVGETNIVKAADKATSTIPTMNNMVNAPLDLIGSGLANSANTKTFSPAVPMSVPKLLARPMPEAPKQKQQVSTKDQKPMQVSVVGGNETIGQNLSDRHLAHAVTGGLGMDALRHG